MIRPKLDAVAHLALYTAFHRESGNKLLHGLATPVVFFTALCLLAYTGLGPPIALGLCVVLALIDGVGALCLLSVLLALCAGAAAVTAALPAIVVVPTAIALHGLAWFVAVHIGHTRLEPLLATGASAEDSNVYFRRQYYLGRNLGRPVAGLDGLIQFAIAPLSVVHDVLVAFGFRHGLEAAVVAQRTQVVARLAAGQAPLQMGMPPSPPAPGLGGFLLGHYPQLRRDRVGLFTEAMRAHGDFVAFRFGHERALLINRPEHLQHVLLDRVANYSKTSPAYQEVRKVLGEGLFTSGGEHWKRQHDAIQPLFQRDRMKDFTGVMVDAAEKAVAALPVGEPVDLSERMMALTLRIVGTTIIGSDVGKHAEAIWASFPELLSAVNARVLQGIPPPVWVPTAANRRFRKALGALDAVVHDIIAAPPSDRPSLLAVLRGTMDAAALRDEVVTMLLAGHETTAVALCWTLQLLAEHPDWMARVVAELGEAPLTYEKVAQLDTLRMCFSEALRLYPPVWLYSRRAEAADAIGGFEVPKGTLVLISPYTLHRNEALWPDPERFDPTRFAKGQTRHKFAYLPFGAGPRTCMGNHFAIIEAMVILAVLLRKFAPALAPGASRAFVPALTLRHRDGLRMTLTPRDIRGACSPSSSPRS